MIALLSIILRDLKLSNLLYKNGNLYICDFGMIFYSAFDA